MNEREFGMLLARVDRLMTDVNEVKHDLKVLLAFRAKLIGVATLVSALIGIGGQVIVWLVGPR